MIPNAFATSIVSRYAKAGRSWLAQLPHQIDDLCARWQLSINGKPMSGFLGLVIPVQRGNQQLALKVAWRDVSVASEAAALRRWRGDGAVRLVEYDIAQQALLLERLNADRTLDDVLLSEALVIAGRLYHRLAVEPPEGIRPQAEIVAEMVHNMTQRHVQFGRNIPPAWFDKTLNLAHDLAQPTRPLLINYDLHYGNVLAGEREPWLVIDPKVIAGDKAFGIAQLLWCRFEPHEADTVLDRLDRLIDSAELDPQKAYAWALIRTVDYWLWALSVGFTDDPLRCAVIAQQLVPQQHDFAGR